ncbi:MAG: DUF1385 domain-containing protein [Candidatus Latescibacteria bacterium]|nr:DUF1385 domain-containing protein [Candidatus Latescibacterota bacterium]OPX23024.1 MAG: hypothetical protein B1H02_05400 [Candidatus Latescibacteria bacterium 4484_107]
MPSKPQSVGGQAVIEGVMMRAPEAIATAVRTLDKKITVKVDPYLALSKRYKILNIPILRGAVSLFEMLVIGIRTLSYSADVAMKEAQEEEQKKEDNPRTKRQAFFDELLLGGSLVLALALGVGLFFFLPLLAAQLLHVSRGALGFNLIAGGIRIAIFLAYLWAISRWKEIRRIFEYHGAEHKSIFTYEAGEELTVECARKYSTLHPRCGTSFILIVAISAILLFSVTDALFVVTFGHLQNLGERFLTHFTFLPLVAGASYELLKLSGKRSEHRIMKAFIAPGLWLQKITTKEPDDEQLEVALVALKSALADDHRKGAKKDNE